MSNKVWARFAQCHIEAGKRHDGRHYLLGAVGERGDGTLVKASNTRTRTPNRKCHAEYRLTKKLDYGAIVYVARVLRDGDYGLAMPCADCIKAMRSKRVHKVYFTIDQHNYGVIPLR